MGWYGSSIGDHRVICHDSSFDKYINVNKPKEWFLEKIINMEFINNLDEEFEIEIPLMRFGHLVKLRKNYRFDLDLWEKDTLTIILFEEINKRELVIEGDVVLYGTNYETRSIFHLKSRVGDNNIVLTNEMNQEPTIIKTKEDVDWLKEKGLSFTTNFLDKRDKNYNPYCPVCTGCGEEGCCSPLSCDMSPNGSYCRTYLRDLKYTYSLYNEVIKLIYHKLSEEDKETFNKIMDKKIDEWYD
jgi:hypothetical protein